jgi:hypothetical protein
MDDPKQFAVNSLHHLKSVLDDCGMTANLRHLAQDVWKGVIDRHEPDELGDTNMSQGIQSVENFKARAKRRAEHDPREPSDRFWDVVGLQVSTPRNSLMITMPDPDGFPVRMVGMKTPVADGRNPTFDTLVDWHADSATRLGYAARNSHVLNDYRSGIRGQDQLPGFDGGTALSLTDFMWLWAGESAGPATAGWVAVPVLGAIPFIAVEPLWWDEEDSPSAGRRKHTPDGPSYDQRTAPVPGLAIKPRAGEEHA